jgi:hypothetical protein
MPSARREWGLAMLAELHELRGAFARWQFALGCAWVAVFSFGSGGVFQMMKTGMRAALVSTALVAPLVYLELQYGRQNYSRFPYELFVILWIVPAAFLLTVAPLVRAFRARESAIGRPRLLMARVSFLLLAALFWTAIVNDQMPCLLGVPNCD